MKMSAILVCVLGFLFLIGIMIFSKPITINSSNDLENLLPNSKVLVKTTVLDQSTTSLGFYLRTSNNISIICNCEYKDYREKQIEVLGIYDDFQYPKIKALKIKSS